MLLQGAGAFGGAVLLGRLAFLVHVTERLVRFREGALRLAVWLLLLELVGGVLIKARQASISPPPHQSKPTTPK
jgi:hypothetical protein